MDANKDKGGDENALEQKPEELNALEQLSSQGGVHEEGQNDETSPGGKKSQKGGIKKLWSKINIYFLVFILLVVVTAIVFIVSYLKSQKQPTTPTTALQDLTQQDLSQIANGDSQVGDPRYTLSIQSNAVFAGNALIRGGLNVAGNVQLGKALSIPSLTVSGTSNLQEAQINTLQVADTTVLQGQTSINNALTVKGKLNAQGDLSVGRSISVGTSLTAPNITVANLTLAGNGNLTLNNHVKATGPTPGRSQGSAVGGGGSTSISGSDLAGTVNVNTGNSPGPGCFVTISFVQHYSSTPRVIISPVGSAAGQTQYYVNRNTTSFSICTANSAPAHQTFAFDYWVISG